MSASPVTRAMVAEILADAELVSALRSALLEQDAGGRIGHHQAAERWGVTPATVAAWCRTGKIDATKRGRVWLVDPSAEPPRRASSGPVAAVPAPARPRTRRPAHRGPSAVERALRGG